ncbi:MAG: ABC transporter permease [Pseudomonadota bacterium]
MIAAALRRIAGAIFVIVLASFLTFLLLQLAPGDAVMAIAQARHGAGVNLDAASLARIRAEIGADDPFLVQWARWAGDLVRLDFGISLIDRRPVVDIMAEGLFRTLELALAAVAVATALSIPLGLLAGVWRGTWFDGLCVALATLGSAMPNWWLGVLLIVVFSVNLGWLPAFGRGDWEHLVLPALTLGTGITVTTARLLRSATIEALAARHIAAARGRGVAETRVIGRHALRNALLPVLTIFALEIAFVLEGAVAVEYVFGLHGLGLIFIEAVDARDYPVIQAFVLFSAVLFVCVNLIVDLLTLWLDPRTAEGMA